MLFLTVPWELGARFASVVHYHSCSQHRCPVTPSQKTYTNLDCAFVENALFYSEPWFWKVNRIELSKWPGLLMPRWLWSFALPTSLTQRVQRCGFCSWPRGWANTRLRLLFGGRWLLSCTKSERLLGESLLILAINSLPTTRDICFDKLAQIFVNGRLRTGPWILSVTFWFGRISRVRPYRN